jgi:hypothetical protein
MSDIYRLFKFRRVDKNLVKSLVSSELWYASPETLNDPFDCQIDLRKSFANAATRAASPRKEQFLAALNSANLLENWTQKFKSVGVCAFSRSNDSPVMWSHYADNHKGVCLLYEFPVLFEQSVDELSEVNEIIELRVGRFPLPRGKKSASTDCSNTTEFPESFFIDKANRIVGVSEVKYDNGFLTNWIETTPFIEDTDNFVLELTKVYLTLKSKPWEYEQEVRILCFSAGPMRLPRSSLKQVCFGLQTPKADIDLVINLASRFSEIGVFHQMEQGSNDFDIQMKPL